MNRQELLFAALLDSLPNTPRFFSSWPYLILICAALLMGASKLHSEAEYQPEFKVTHAVAPQGGNL